jgi:hypothetical protein
MHLGDRGGGDGLVVESGEQALDRLAQLGFDQRARPGAGKGRQTVLQARQIGGDLLAQEIGARREELAELDEARPQLVERGGQPLAGARRARAAAAGEDARDPQERGQGRDPFERKQRVVARQGDRDAEEAQQVAPGPQRPRQRSERVRDARPNGVQRRPPSDCGT